MERWLFPLLVLAAASTATVMVVTRRILRPSEIADVARAAGFSGDDLITAVAIAMAESGGDAHAYNPEEQAGTPPGMGSYGLWQIYLWAHPEFAGWDLYDPAQNARAAYQIYARTGDFRAWSTYKNQAYARYLPDVQAEVTA